MPNPKIQDKLLKLPTPYKIIGLGALIALIGAFFPWYQDIDSFNTGDRFSGITGPLYLIGYIIIGLSVISLILTGFHLFEKKLPDLPLKESMIYILSGAFSLFLLVITNSIYFHPKFGTNITSKEYQFGMIFAFAGAIAAIIGGVLESRERGTARFIEEFQSEAQEDEDIDEVIALNNFQKEQQRERDVIDRTKSSSGVREYKTKSDWAPVSQAEPARMHSSSSFKNSVNEPVQPSQPTKVWREPFPDSSLLRKEREPGRIMSAGPSSANPQKEKEEINPNSVIRMDL
jgi:hypothetical protein